MRKKRLLLVNTSQEKRKSQKANRAHQIRPLSLPHFLPHPSNQRNPALPSLHPQSNLFELLSNLFNFLSNRFEALSNRFEVPSNTFDLLRPNPLPLSKHFHFQSQRKHLPLSLLSPFQLPQRYLHSVTQSRCSNPLLPLRSNHHHYNHFLLLLQHSQSP